MTEEQRQAALEALDRLENDALCYRDGYGETRKDAETIRHALQDPPVPVIEGLEEAIQYLIRLGDLHSIEAEKWRTTDLYMMYETLKEKSNMIRKCIKAAEEYSKLQKGE